jgi:hypothetical protein
MKPEEFAAWWLIVRDMLLVVTGLGLLVYFAAIYETAGPEPRWPYVIAAGLGVSPVFLRKGDKAVERRTGPEEHP